MIIRSALELTAIILLLYGFKHEKQVAEFESRMYEKLKERLCNK